MYIQFPVAAIAASNTKLLKSDIQHLDWFVLHIKQAYATFS